MPTPHRLNSFLVSLLILWLFVAFPFIHSNTFTYNEFKESSILLIKDASIHSELVLTLTNNSQLLLGRALYPTPVRFKTNNTDNNSKALSFSTTFVFSIVVPRKDQSGHGLAFIMTPYKSLMGAMEAQYLGLLNATTNGLESNHLFAVEFDTYLSFEFEDINDNHVGVNLNSLNSLQAQAAGYWIGERFQNCSLKSSENIQAWIDYDHLQDQLNVTVALAGMEKPKRPLISVKDFDLHGVLEEEMYVGFSSATGFYAVENHYILGWSFSTEGMAPPLNLSRLPSFITKKPMTKSRRFIASITVASVVLLLVPAFFVFRWLRRLKSRESIEEWELEFWPHRIQYKELTAATQGFKDEHLLGCGGFGRVYRGILPKTGVQVAVKSITRDSTEGMKDFIAEISSLGRLQHRNLVQLRGWCRKNKQLFIVYDYMPNGSLDKMIFGNPNSVLSWPQRYEILKGIAAGLLYLHEQWDRRVVHRDVKSSNILLDSELNAKLGDFGLARLYEHTQNPQTTRVVGTVGYIAPEVTNTGKVTPSSDVFSFGIVLLEVACGRRPVDQCKGSEQEVLVEWVRDLHQKGKLVYAADPNLNGVYDVEEMERVLKLGLFCSDYLPERRLGIRTALQILEGEAPLPLHDIPSFDMTRNHRSFGNIPSSDFADENATSSIIQYDQIDSDYGVGR